jgi:ATP-dependent 26S proteasome regulatory subunit
MSAAGQGQDRHTPENHRAAEKSSLYSAYGKKVGGGILLYGHPGCAKLISPEPQPVRRMRYSSGRVSTISWICISEAANRNCTPLFEFAGKTASVLFFDEVDASEHAGRICGEVPEDI